MNRPKLAKCGSLPFFQGYFNTPLEHTPSNLYQQAISRDSFHSWRTGDCRTGALYGCVVIFLDFFFFLYGNKLWVFFSKLGILWWPLVDFDFFSWLGAPLESSLQQMLKIQPLEFFDKGGILKRWRINPYKVGPYYTYRGYNPSVRIYKAIYRGQNFI